MELFDTVIIGGGAAAHAAAIYARRYGMSALIVEGEFGGETAVAGKIENYPGLPPTDGFDLMQNLKSQVDALGVNRVSAEAREIMQGGHCFVVKTLKGDFSGKTLILATGMERRKLNVPGESELKGKGVHYCVTCDGPLFKGKRVAVVGGGDAAVKGAVQLADMGAEHVSLLVREQNIDRAEAANRARLESLPGEKLSVYFETEVKKINGASRVSSIEISHAGSSLETVELDGVFVEIGYSPKNELPKELGLRMDESGQIEVDPRTMATSVDGIFAAGDVTNGSGKFKQLVTAVSQGALAAYSAYNDLAVHGKTPVCDLHAVPSALLQTREAAHPGEESSLR